MKKRRRIVFVGLVVAVLALAVWFALRPREPVYQGKKLSAWLEQAAQWGDDWSPELEEAVVAIEHIGTNAIPILLTDLQAKHLPDLVVSLIERVSPFGRDYSRLYIRERRALAGFRVLGQTAEPAIPKLRSLMFGNDNATATLAQEALREIGGEGAVAILAHGLTNANLRYNSAFLLGRLRSQSLLAVPALVTNLETGDARMREYAAKALGQIALQPKLAVPALLKGMADADSKVQLDSISALAQFGKDASAAAPALEQTRLNQDKRLSNRAKWALHLIQREIRDGGVFRGPRDKKAIALVFTGHEYAEGAETILVELGKRRAKASFFVTGDFLANTNLEAVVRRILKDEHLLGPHSDKHLLYCSWDTERKTLLSREEFRQDVGINLDKIHRAVASEHSLSDTEYTPEQKEFFKRFRITSLVRYEVRYFLPAYENYNRQIADWAKEMELTLINFTPGTRSNADYKGEADTNFVSSHAIFDSIVQKEREDPHGLNGFILLFHLGSGPGRKDKFHYRFGELLDDLAGKGYQFVRVDELLEPKLEETPRSESPQ